MAGFIGEIVSQLTIGEKTYFEVKNWLQLRAFKNKQDICKSSQFHFKI